MSEIEIEGLTTVDGIDRLQDGFLFKGLSFDETETLSGICRAVEKKAGERIIEEKSPSQGLYLVVKGAVRVFQGEGAKAKTLDTLKPGEIFGEMSLIEDVLTMASVVAVGDVKLLHIEKRDLERLMEKDARFASKIYRAFCVVLSERLRKATRKLGEVTVDG